VSVSCIAGKRIYVTSSTFTGNLKGSSANASIGADAKCMVDSNKPSDVTVAKALMTDIDNRRACLTVNCSGGPSDHRDWVLAATTQYLRTDGVVIGTTDANGIFNSGTALTHNSISTVHTPVWTGFAADGQAWVAEPGDTCGHPAPGSEWTVGDGSQTGMYGYADATNYSSGTGAFSNNILFCNSILALYCVEQ
jgi:hypothetical protein